MQESLTCLVTVLVRIGLCSLCDCSLPKFCSSLPTSDYLCLSSDILGTSRRGCVASRMHTSPANTSSFRSATGSARVGPTLNSTTLPPPRLHASTSLYAEYTMSELPTTSNRSAPDARLMEACARAGGMFAPAQSTPNVDGCGFVQSFRFLENAAHVTLSPFSQQGYPDA